MIPGDPDPNIMNSYSYTYRLREHPLLDHQSIVSTARKEVEALGYLTGLTAMVLRSAGVDPAVFERRALDSAY